MNFIVGILENYKNSFIMETIVVGSRVQVVGVGEGLVRFIGGHKVRSQFGLLCVRYCPRICDHETLTARLRTLFFFLGKDG